MPDVFNVALIVATAVVALLLVVGAVASAWQAVRATEAELQKTGATWIVTTDYRTYSMLRWFLGDRVPVIQINERGRFMGFRDPGMNLIAGHTGLYVGREPDDRTPIWASTTAVRQPLERVERSWRGIVMDSYTLEKLTGWTPELSPPPDSPLFRWRVLAGDIHSPWRVAVRKSFRGARSANPESRDSGSGPADHPGMT